MTRVNHARMTRRRIDPTRALRQVLDEGAGGTVLFVGTIRRKGDKGRVDSLEYQAYSEMAERRMKKIEAEVRSKWPVKKVTMMHREGRLRVGEVSVVVAVSSEHRAEAFEACRYAIDRIKKTLPLWKREHAGRRGRWVEGVPIEKQRN
jgi:molybdopterin synthase catalytic subunit